MPTVSRITPCLWFDSQAEEAARFYGEGGDEEARQFGWLKDKFGASWQVVPHIMVQLMTGDQAHADRVMAALLKMNKLDIAELLRARRLSGCSWRLAGSVSSFAAPAP